MSVSKDEQSSPRRYQHHSDVGSLKKLAIDSVSDQYGQVPESFLFKPKHGGHILPLIFYPNAQLTVPSTAELPKGWRHDDGVRKTLVTLAENMAFTMYSTDGVGLSAIQVGVYLPIVVMGICTNNMRMGLNELKDLLMVLIKPEVVAMGPVVKQREGCLSFPAVFEMISRPEWVEVKALALDGTEHTFRVDDLLARVMHHEIDHTIGETILDRMDKEQRARTIARIRQFKKDVGALSKKSPRQVGVSSPVRKRRRKRR